MATGGAMRCALGSGRAAPIPVANVAAWECRDGGRSVAAA